MGSAPFSPVPVRRQPRPSVGGDNEMSMVGHTRGSDQSGLRGKDFILRLPDELLCQILEELFLGRHTSWYLTSLAYETNARTAAAAQRVCRRFASIIRPMLYAQLALEFQLPKYLDGDDSACRLYRTLSEDVRIRGHCNALRISVTGDEVQIENLCALRRDRDPEIVVSWMRNVRLLVLAGGWSPRLNHQVVASAVDHMKLLQQLTVHLHNNEGDFQFEELYGVLTSERAPCLKALELSGFRIPFDDTGLKKLVNETSESQRICCEKRYHGRAPFRSLTMRRYQGSEASLAWLLAWPGELDEFSFTGVRSPHLFNIGDVHKAIEHHKSTLRCLTVGGMDINATWEGQYDIFRVDFTSFERLEKLSLSYWGTAAHAEHAPFLLAPSLKEFTWTFDVDVENMISWTGPVLRFPRLTDFMQEQEDYLRRLANAAIGEKHPLRRIHVSFHPHGDIGLYPDHLRYFLRDFKNPFERLDEIAMDLRPHGIDVSYDKSSMSEVVRRMIASYRRLATQKFNSESR